MDYKYIEQLLERYWQCETSLEEEDILRSFFSQKDVPVSLLPYKDLFTYEQAERHNEQLDEQFDAKMLEMVGEEYPVKARTLKFSERLKPLFKAAAVVAIILTLGNALQMAQDRTDSQPQNNMAVDLNRTKEGPSIAQRDSFTVDTVANVTPQAQLIE